VTRVFGVIGYPVAHSLSPAMHNAAMQALKLDGIYSPFPVPPSQLSRMLDRFLLAGVDGLNVTLPHKEAVFRYLLRHGSIDPVAKRIGAVNTVVRRGTRWVGYNTDWLGFREALRADLRSADLDERTVLLLGAGGAARAVAYALRSEKVLVYVANRGRARLRQFKRWTRGLRPGRAEVVWAELGAGEFPEVAQDIDVVVNATSLGLKGGDPLPIDPRWLKKGARVIDLAYRPPTTTLVRAARRRGLVAIDGLPMLVYQGAAAFQLWWKRRPPVAVMRRAVERAAR
jgi:shikimate dehydrogenase